MNKYFKFLFFKQVLKSYVIHVRALTNNYARQHQQNAQDNNI